jgi:hypothetical protein
LQLKSQKLLLDTQKMILPLHMLQTGKNNIPVAVFNVFTCGVEISPMRVVGKPL